jgi:hypothetical protein
MPANGQKAAGEQLNKIFGINSGYSQRTVAAQNDVARASTTAAAVTKATTASPPTAADAPTKGTNNIFTGLCEALNRYQKDLVKKGTYEVADQYTINFAPPSIGASKVTKPGPVTYKNTAGKSVKTAADKVDSQTDQVNVNSQNWNILAGTQVVQLIDQVMRSSTYITSQQKVNIDENGKQTNNAKAGTSGVTAWYKINLSAKQLAYDKKRRDNAYAMTFTVTPYAINQMASPYFSDSTYRGAHKSYNYWFTGQNTQILSYEQDYNQAYYTTITANASGLVVPPPTGRDQFKQTHMATSEQRGQGQANYVNEPADSAASFLYSITDFSEVRMKIVGDPAWLQQGEAAFGVTAATFEFTPFDPDGGINYDSQEVTFTVSFSRPTDYDFNTGIMNISATGAPQETFTFLAKSCKSTFSKGQFTQELVGSLLPGTNSVNAAATANGRSNPLGGLLTAAGSRASSLIQSAGNALSLSGNVSTASSAQTGTLTGNDSGATTGGTGSPQPAGAAKAPTSSGDIEPAGDNANFYNNAEYEASDNAPDSTNTSSSSQLIANDDAQEDQ